MSVRCGVTAVAVAVGLAVGAGGAASAQTALNPKPALYVFTGGEGGEVFGAGHFPRVIWVSDQDFLSGLSWRSGTATGTFNHDDCLPNCARGSYIGFAIKLTAADPEWCTVTLYNRELVRSTRRAFVYDTIAARGTGRRLPYVPSFRHACT
jgi:hypothetical protein